MTTRTLVPPCILLLVTCCAPSVSAQTLPSGSSYERAAAGRGGAIEGSVRFAGEVPRLKVADDSGVRRPLLEVDATTGGLADVVLHLVDVPAAQREGGEPWPLVTIDQEQHTFVPHVVAVRPGQRVAFTNSDPVNHNVRGASLVAENEFNIYTGLGGRHEREFVADPRGRPIALGCDIHGWMRGWIYVFDHPWFAVSDRRGHYRIGGVPAGTWRLVLRQPDGPLAAEQQVTVEEGAVARVDISFRAADLRSK